MKEAFVVYAPNQDELENVVLRLKTRDNERLKKELEYFFEEIRGYNSFVADDTTRWNYISFSEYCILKEIKETVYKLLFEENYRINKFVNELWQACMFVLLSLEYSFIEEEYELGDKDYQDVYFAGCSFGEFWSLMLSENESAMEESFSMEQVMNAYFRGEMMRKATEEINNNELRDCGKIIIRDHTVSIEQCEEYDEILRENGRLPLGRLVLEDGTICLYGSNELERFAAMNKLDVEFSILFHSIRLYDVGTDFSKRFEMVGASESFITDKSSTYIPEIIARQFYDSVDERKLLHVIKEKLYAKGFKKVTIIRL